MIGKRTLWSLAAAAALALAMAAGPAAASEADPAGAEIGPAVGSPAPDFELAAVTDGAEHTLSEHLGERPVVMVFFRGSW
ncbi:MAG TPA: hypothetical protein VF150_10430 [Thermoanaerobaculia bacterium]